MSAEYLVLSDDETSTVSPTELCQRLAEELGIPDNAGICTGERRFAFEGRGIEVSSVLDESGNAMAAMVEVAPSAKVEHVSRLFRAFKAMGWVF